ncbi:GrpB family protein [Streptomyces caelestis]|uniref:GrpB family protein n=1 Tax=Streptomyces caelestis TaxID=36816 RepID=UPI003652479E
MPVPERAVVVPHDPRWEAEGRQCAHELRTALSPWALCAEHVWSTAVPGMAAKPVLDMQVGVHDLPQAAPVFDRVPGGRGFTRLPIDADHVPAGRAGDQAGWKKLLYVRRDAPRRDVNLHVRLRGAPNERFALLFRDWFRAHPEARPAYACFKTVLAEAVGDVATYSEIKDPVVDLVIVLAE